PVCLFLPYPGGRGGDAALKGLADPPAEVSCHYFVSEAGEVVQMVPESRRAWHAGKAIWEGVEDVNSRSIGIEIANPGHDWGYRDFPPTQMAAVRGLCTDIVARHGIAPQHVLGHSDVAPLRKADPGEKFDWA